MPPEHNLPLQQLLAVGRPAQGRPLVNDLVALRNFVFQLLQLLVVVGGIEVVLVQLVILAGGVTLGLLRLVQLEVHALLVTVAAGLGKT